MDSCPDANRIARWYAQRTSLPQDVRQHMERCPLCLPILEDWEALELGETPPAAPDQAAAVIVGEIGGNRRGAPDFVNRRIGGKYELRRLIGHGGMGAVFQAMDTESGNLVAVKLLRSEYAGDKTAIQRFRLEAQRVRGVKHPNIVHVIALCEDAEEDVVFMVQELLHGTNLRERLHADKSLPWRDALAVMLPVMGAIATAHSVGIIHRDIKPANIFLVTAPHGVVVPKVIDFGISKNVTPADQAPDLSRSDVSIGTPLYMSPEQVSGKVSVDERADIWSCGVVLYESLAGVHPFRSIDPVRLAAKILQDEPPLLVELAPKVPAEICQIVHRALAKTREQRWNSLADMAAALLYSAPIAQDPVERARFEHFRGCFPSLLAPRFGWGPRSKSILTAAAGLMLVGSISVGMWAGRKDSGLAVSKPGTHDIDHSGREGSPVTTPPIDAIPKSVDGGLSEWAPVPPIVPLPVPKTDPPKDDPKRVGDDDPALAKADGKAVNKIDKLDRGVKTRNPPRRYAGPPHKRIPQGPKQGTPKKSQQAPADQGIDDTMAVH